MRAVVTGAASGIGKATALVLADAGREVVAVDKDVHGLASMAALDYNSQRQNVHRCVADISTPEGAEELKKVVGDAAVDVVIHCAGYLVSKPIMALDVRKFERLMDSTIIAPLLVVQSLLPNLKKANGARIILTTGGANKTYVPSLGAHGASTGALKQIWRTLRYECKEFADVGLCLPGIVMTPAWEPYLEDDDWPFQAYFRQRLVEGGDCHQASEVAEWYAALLDKQKVDSETFTQTEFNIDNPKHQFGVKVTLTSEGKKIVGDVQGAASSLAKNAADSNTPAKVEQLSGPAKGNNDMDTVVLRHKTPCGEATAEVYLFGATLTSYKTPEGKERIFVSPGAIFDGKKAIRGGVPLVFPQFGQPDKGIPQHGVARTSIWTLKEVVDSVDSAKAILTLSDNEDTRSKWPHAFALEFTVELQTEVLIMNLDIKNTGDAAFKFHALLHTYFMIPDISEVAIKDLIGRNYVDNVAGGETKEEKESEIVLPSFTDRVYVGTEASCQFARIGRKGGGAAVTDTSQEATVDGERVPVDVVVWNPYEEASPGDLPPPAFKNFVCVEPGMVNEFRELAPNSVANLSQRIIPKSEDGVSYTVKRG